MLKILSLCDPRTLLFRRLSPRVPLNLERLPLLPLLAIQPGIEYTYRCAGGNYIYDLRSQH